MDNTGRQFSMSSLMIQEMFKQKNKEYKLDNNRNDDLIKVLTDDLKEQIKDIRKYYKENENEIHKA